MSKNAVISLDFDAFEASEIGRMNVLDKRGQPTGWVWEFAGPGHPQTEAQNSRIARERLHRDRQIETAQVNGRKWRADDEDPEAVRARNIANIVERIVGWSPIEIGGKPFLFTAQNATEFLSHPKRVGVLAQVMEFLASEGAFTQRSE